MSKEISPGRFAGDRSRLFIKPLADALNREGVLQEKSVEVAMLVGHYLAKLDSEIEKTADDEAKGKVTGKRKKNIKPSGDLRVKTLMFLSPAEIDAIAGQLSQLVRNEADDKQLQKAAAAACKSAALKDAADIAIFGRMVASDHSLTVEGAGLFSHALSTHRADNDIDFFSAVDDLQPEEEAGAGMTGTLEFTSATYYRYIALNLGMLKNEKHLGALTREERQNVVEAFLRAATLAVPNARKNSMNAHTLPGYVLGVVREGQPLQLINAFENPVRAKNGVMEASIATLKEHYKQLKETWNITPTLEMAIPDRPLDEFCNEILRHV
jgi:CRISPR system Cascade subunit CasC